MGTGLRHALASCFRHWTAKGSMAVTKDHDGVAHRRCHDRTHPP